MTKMLKMVGVAVGVMGLISSHAATIQYSDLDSYSGAGILLDSGHPTFTGNLGITTDDADGIADQTGYSPGSGLLAALAGFTFTAADGNFLPRELTFQLQGDPFATPYSSGTALTWAINDLVVGNALLTLAGDGDIDFTITYVSGPAFFLNTATLTAFQNSDRKVPDGGSMAMLMGLGVAALGLARRQIR